MNRAKRLFLIAIFSTLGFILLGLFSIFIYLIVEIALGNFWAMCCVLGGTLFLCILIIDFLLHEEN